MAKIEFDSKATVDLQDVSAFDIKTISHALDDVTIRIDEMQRLFRCYVNDLIADDDQTDLEAFEVGELLESIRWLAECVSDLTD